MKWEWAPRDCSDPEFMGPSGNWETADGTRFFCLPVGRRLSP